MKVTEYSINSRGCSVCKAGEENYTTFRPSHRPRSLYYQYDYRDESGNLFSVAASTLDECRAKRDKWVQAKNYERLLPCILKMIQDNKRITKSELAYQIGHIAPFHVASVSYEIFKRDEMVSIFNRMFGTEIK